MARRSIDGYLPYLNDVLSLWMELGTDFKVGTLTYNDVVNLRSDLASVLERINTLQTQLGLAAENRAAKINGIESFAVQFRAAVVGQFGPKSAQAQRVPKLAKARGRGNASTPPTPPAP